MPDGQTTELLYPEIFDYLTAIEKRRKLKKTLGEFQIDGDKYNLLAAIDAGISEDLLIEAFGQETYKNALAEKQKPIEPTVVPEIPLNQQPLEWFGDIEKQTQFEQEVISALPQELRAQYGNIPMEEFVPKVEEYFAPIEERRATLLESFSQVFPEVAKLGEPVIDEWLNKLDTDEQFREAFASQIIAKGRTTETENLLKAMGLDVFQVAEIFSQPGIGDEFLTPEMIQKYIKGEEKIPTNPVIEEKKSLWNTFYGSLRKSIHNTSQAVNKLLSMAPMPLFADLLPEERVEQEKQARQWYYQNYTQGKVKFQDWLAKHPEVEPPVEIQQFKEKAGQLPFLKQLGTYLGNPKAMAYTIAEGAPPTLAALGAFTATTAATGNPILGGLASFATFAPMQIEDVAQDLISAGADEDQAYELALPVGMIISSLDVVGELPLLKAISPVLKGLTKGLQKELVERTMVALFKKGLITFTTQEFTEALTEVSQQVIQDYTVSFFDKTRDPFGNVSQTAVQTLIQVAPFALFGGGVTMLNGRSVKLADLYKQKTSEYEKAGYPTQEAKIQALNGLAKFPEGETAIKNTYDDIVEKEGITPEVTAKPPAEVPTIAPVAGVTPPVTPTAVTPIPKAEVGEPEAGLQPVKVATAEITKPEKAKNIRLEKYPEEIRDTIKEWADTHGEEVNKATRGIVSDEQVRAEAEKLTGEVGGDVDKLRKKWKPGKTWNAEELVAIRSILRTKTKGVLNVQKLVKENNSAQNLLKLEVALKEQAAVQEIVHGLTAEAGRALRSFRQQTFDAIKSNDISRMEELLKKIRGREDTEKIAEMLGRLDPSDSLAVNKFIQELYKPHAMDYITELFYNSILSGPKTHIVNSLSNTANALLSPVERFVSSLVDLPLSVIQQRPRARYFSEVPADVFGAIRGIPEGFRQFAYVIKNGISFDQATKWEFRQKAFKGKLGAVVSMPSRFLEAADMLMKTINQRAALNAEAHRIVSSEKLSGQPFEDRVAELLSSPTEDMLNEANRIAEYRLFRQPPGRFGQTLMNLRDAVDVRGFRPLRFVIPFIRTPLNLVKFGLERTPLGFVNPKLWQNVAQNNPEAADQIARAMIGSVGLATLSWFFAAGMITGAPPRDRAERERFYREGKQPYAIRVDGFWVSYQRLEPFNQLLSMVAIIGDMIRNDDKGIDEKILDAVNTFGQNFVSQTYMSSVSDLIDMLSEPERYAGKWLNRFASSLFVPMSSATRTAAQMLDRTVRDPKNAIETIEANIPGLSKNVQSKLTALGEDIERKSPPWFPINITPVEETVLSRELERLEFDIGFVGDTISGVKLSDAEQRDYQILAGQLVKSDLEKLMVAPEYWNASDIEKNKMLRKVVDTARDWARTKMREKMWGEKAPDERIGVLSTALKNSDNLLGKVVSDVQEFTHEKPNIYDIAHELNSSYNTLLSSIPQGNLNGLNVPTSVASWYAKEQALKESSLLPDVILYRINADPTKGNTFEDYATQWQRYNEITDEREREDFIKKYPDYGLGNIPRRQLDLLRQFHALSKSEQAQFIIDHSELKQNPKTEWLKSHPKENAQLAIWGQAKILTQGVYDEFKRLVKELDIPDGALSEQTMPPDGSVKNYFKYLDIVGERSANSWEVQLLLSEDNDLLKFLEREPIETPIESLKLKVKNRDLFDLADSYSDKESPNYIEDDKARQKAIEKLRKENPEWVDDTRRIEAIEKGTDEKPINEKLIKTHVEYMRMQDAEGVGSSTAEVMLYRVDNPEYNKWRMDTEVWGNKVLQEIDEEKIPIWRIDVKWRAQDAKYDAIDPDAKNPKTGIRLRDEMLALPENTDYRKDRRRRNAYQLNLSGGVVEKYVDFYELPETGYRRERYRMNNPDLDKVLTNRNIMGDSVMVPVDPTEVPVEEYDNLREKWVTELGQYEKEIPKKYETIVDSDKRAKLIREDRAKLLANKEFADDRLRINAYGDFFPEEYVENYVEYYNIPDKGYANERYLKEHPDFYKVIKETLGWTEDIKFDKIPTERFENAFNNNYDILPKGKSREDFRWNSRWFDEEGAKLGWWKLLERGPKLSQADRLLMEWYNRLQELEKAGEEQLVK